MHTKYQTALLTTHRKFQTTNPSHHRPLRSCGALSAEVEACQSLQLACLGVVCIVVSRGDHLRPGHCEVSDEAVVGI
jgi:hypothetical protein